ncbi:MAG: autotransporter-associated beta strand repeat-containing protein, partial [Dolichospermum sp.]
NYGNWYATYSDGTTSNAATSTGSNNIGGTTSYKNFVFTCLLTAPNRMNITITDGTTTSNLNDVLLNNSNAITEYSIFLSDDWNGANHRDIYWNTNSSAASDYVKNTLTMPIGSSNGSFTISGALPNGTAADSTSTASVNALTKSGTGALTLTGANTYTGATNIDAGELWIGSGGSIASTATLTVGNAAATTAKLFLSKSDGGTTFSNNIAINSGNSGTRFLGGVNSSGTNTFSGAIYLPNTINLSLEATSANGTTNFTGQIRQNSLTTTTSGTLTIIGPGTIQLSGDNGHSGITTINSGATLKLGATTSNGSSGPLGGNSSGTTVNSGGTFYYNGFTYTGSTASEVITLNVTGVTSACELIN